MFRTVRHWWEVGSGRHAARLFVFELTVVVLGVLIAQFVTATVQAQQAQSHMEEERDRARRELSFVHLSSLEWQAAMPCLEQRMTEVIEDRVPADPAALSRPSMNRAPYTPPDEASLILIERKYGPAEKAKLIAMSVNGENLHDEATTIATDWGRLSLIAPSRRPLDPEDRRQARYAAADILAQLRGAAITVANSITRLRQMNVPVGEPEIAGRGPAKSCAAIWKSGRIDPPATT